MKKLSTLLVMFTLGTLFTQAQNITGKWKTIDDETKQEKSIVEIYESEGKYYGKVIEILNPAKKKSKCTECKGTDKDKPIEGLVIIKGLSKDGKEWTGGKILDPSKGKTYSCTVTLDGNDKLNVRGYAGISLLGRTQVWTKVK